MGSKVRLFSLSIAKPSDSNRGWGRSVKSPRQKGDSGPTPRVLADITSMLRTLLPSSVPLFLMGHSMGGAEVLTWAAQGPSELRAQLSGVLAESPFVRLDPTAEPWRITVALGRLAGRLAPHAHMVQKLNASAVCRDPEVVKGYIEDPLCHDTGTLEQLAGMLDRAAALDKGAVLIGKDCKALWVSHGSEDHIVIHEASKRYVERCVAVQDKEYKEYPGWFHTCKLDRRLIRSDADIY